MDEATLRLIHSEPIEEYVAALATDEDLPVSAVEACAVRYDEAGPLLRAMLARAADGPLADAKDERLLCCALLIAAKQRDPLVFEPLLRALRRPQDEGEVLLDDAATECLPRIVAGVFDGDAEALLEAVVDPRLDEYVRNSLLGAATFLTWQGRIERGRMERFLERFEAEGPMPDGDLSWSGWLTAVSLLGFRRLLPNAARVLGKDTLADFMSLEEFTEELDRAEQEPQDATRFAKADLGYIDSVDDILEVLAWFSTEEETWDEYSSPEGDDDEPPSQPVINPWRHVGRNDPCPCGSGKKAKRCCLAA